MTINPLIIDAITLEPSMWSALNTGIVGRAHREKLWNLKTWQLRDFSDKADGRIDDKPYGGNPGMVITYPPLQRALESIHEYRKSSSFVILPDPAGERLTQPMLQALSQKPHLTFVCGRYEGIDERFCQNHVDLRVSVGPYVVSAGDLPAMMMIDGMVRLLPGALGNMQSAPADSFQDWLVDHPCYTRPQVHHEQKVPEVLLQGNHQKIENWERKHRLARTLKTHPERFIGQQLSQEDVSMLRSYFIQLQDDNTSG